MGSRLIDPSDGGIESAMLAADDRLAFILKQWFAPKQSRQNSMWDLVVMNKAHRLRNLLKKVDWEERSAAAFH